MRPELAGEQIDEDCRPAICDCGPDYFVKVPLRRSSECCGYTNYERASSSAEYQSSVGVDLVMCLSDAVYWLLLLLRTEHDKYWA